MRNVFVIVVCVIVLFAGGCKSSSVSSGCGVEKTWTDIKPGQGGKWSKEELADLQENQKAFKESDKKKKQAKRSEKKGGFVPLFKDDLSNAQFNPGSWELKAGVLAAKAKGDIWTKKDYADFVLELEFKCEEDTNSGVFLRCSDTVKWLHAAMEVQILQPDNNNKKHTCGGIFDCLAPTKQMIKKPGEWNKYKITAKDNKIEVILNGEQVVDMDLNDWKEARKNPDGSSNKFKTAYKDMKRSGKIGFQYHGRPVWFRNFKIKEL